jgi:hypothetical protein
LGLGRSAYKLRLPWWQDFVQEAPMTGKVKPIPDGHHSVTPYLIIKGVVKAMKEMAKG